jgi:hypothetical protein
MKRKWVIVVVVAVALFLILVPMVPTARPTHPNCVYCPEDSGIVYSSITYALFGSGVYYTVWGTFVFGL